MLEPKLRDDAEEIIESFIQAKLSEAGKKGVVVGVSGGLDSAVVASLCVRALGKERVLAVMMPESASDPKDLDHGRLVADNLGMDSMVIDITEAVKALAGIAPKMSNRMSDANVKARCRMITLYYLANSLDYLVMGCGNKTEIMVGYFTKFGDGGADYMPIGDLYKTQVRELARRLKVPEEIIEKAPTAGLWKGQTDEGEMGITYDLLDRILLGIETGIPNEKIARDAGTDLKTVEMVQGKIRASAHKRRLPQIPKLGLRTPGFDWREY